MPYNYEAEKHKIFTDVGQREFLKVRDRAKHLLDEAGAFMMFAALKDVSGSAWELRAYLDRLVELGEIREITNVDYMGQNRVFIRA